MSDDEEIGTKSIFAAGNYSDQVIHLSSLSKGNKISQTVLHVHRVILACGSPVFERMIFGPMNNKNYIEIHEDNRDMFYKLLEFLYKRELIDMSNWSKENITDLMQLAHRYMVQELVELCGQHIVPNTLSSLLFNALNLGILLNAKKLVERCTKLIQEKTLEVFHHEDFTKLSADALIHILKQNELNVESEIDVFKVALRWAHARACADHSSFDETGFPKTSSPKPHYPRRVFMNRDISNIMSNNQNSMDLFHGATQFSQCNQLSLDSAIDVDSQMMDTATTTSTENILRNQSSIRSNEEINNDLDNRTENHEAIPENCEDFTLEYGTKLRAILEEKNVLYHIRFLSMTPNEFANEIPRKYVLKSDEIASILLSLNLSQNSMSPSSLPVSMQTPLETICPIRIPRVYSASLILPHNEDGHGTVEFHFRHPFWLECSGFAELEETFLCVSAHPIMIESILIPPRHRRQRVCSEKYEEEMDLKLYILDELGQNAGWIAGGIFRVRRKYDECKEYKLEYNMSDKAVALVSGTRFTVRLCFAKQGFYLGGFEYRKDHGNNDIISVDDNKLKGIVRGFKYSFIRE